MVWTIHQATGGRVVAEVDSIIESHKESVGITASLSDDVSSSFESDERKKKKQVTVFR
jgi:hypothetical protein